MERDYLKELSKSEIYKGGWIHLLPKLAFNDRFDKMSDPVYWAPEIHKQIINTCSLNIPKLEKLSKALKKEIVNCSIYRIINLINKKKYIGQSIKPEIRFNNHIWEANHKNSDNVSYLYQSMSKYGAKNFSYDIILTLEGNNPQWKIDRLEFCYCHLSRILRNEAFGYNLEIPKLGSHKQHTHSKEWKELLSKTRRGEKNPFFGMHHSKNHKDKMSKIMRYRERNPSEYQLNSKIRKLQSLLRLEKIDLISYHKLVLNQTPFTQIEEKLGMSRNLTYIISEELYSTRKVQEAFKRANLYENSGAILKQFNRLKNIFEEAHKRGIKIRRLNR